MLKVTNATYAGLVYALVNITKLPILELAIEPNYKNVKWDEYWKTVQDSCTFLRNMKYSELTLATTHYFILEDATTEDLDEIGQMIEHLEQDNDYVSGHLFLPDHLDDPEGEAR